MHTADEWEHATMHASAHAFARLINMIHVVAHVIFSNTIKAVPNKLRCIFQAYANSKCLPDFCVV